MNLGLLDEYGNPVHNVKSSDFDFNKLFLSRPAAAIRILIFETEEDAERASKSLPNNVIVMVKQPSVTLEQYAQALATLTMPVASSATNSVDSTKSETAMQTAAARALSNVPSRATVAKPATRPVPAVAKPLLEQNAVHFYTKTSARPAFVSVNLDRLDQLEQVMNALTARVEARLFMSHKFSTYPIPEDFLKNFDSRSMSFSNEFAQIQSLVDKLRR